MAVEDGEAVGAIAAINGHGIAISTAEIAIAGLHGADRIARLHDGGGNRVGPKKLAELICVTAAAAVDDGDRAVVVNIEAVVAATTIDLQQADGGVVVDPLIILREAAAGGLQQCDKICLQQEIIRCCRTIDRQCVRPCGRCGAVMDGHDVVARPGGIDGILVVSALAVDIHCVTRGGGAQPGDDAGGTGGTCDVFMRYIEAVQIADSDAVIARPTPDIHLTGNRRRCAVGGDRAQRDDGTAHAGIQIALTGHQRTVDLNRIAAGPALNGHLRGGGERRWRRAKRAGIGCRCPRHAANDLASGSFAESIRPVTTTDRHGRCLHCASDQNGRAGYGKDRRPSDGIARQIALVVTLQEQRHPGLYGSPSVYGKVVASQNARGAANLHHKRIAKRVGGVDDDIARTVGGAANRTILRDEQ